MRALSALLSLAFALVACGPGAAPDTWSLREAMGRAGAVEFVAPDGPLRSRAERLAAELEARTSYRVSVSSPGASSSAGRAVRIRLGVLADEEIRALAARVGVTPLDGGGFEVLGRSHTAPTDALVAAFADPDRAGLPLVLIAGSSEELLARRVRALPAPWEPRLRTWSALGGDLELRLEIDGTPRQETLVEGPLPLVPALVEGPAASRSFTLLASADLPAASRDAYADACGRAAERVREWLDEEQPAPRLEVVLHAHAEDFVRSTDEAGADGLAACDPATSRVDALVAAGLPDDGGAALARATALALAGEAALPWLEDAVGVAAAGTWWGRPLAEWGAVLEEGGLLPAADVLVQPGAGSRSVHVLVPARGLLLLDALARGAELGALWRGEEELPDGSSAHAETEPGTGVMRREERVQRRARALDTPQRGVALFDAGESAYGGDDAAYAARTVARSLEQARAHGANAFSLTVQATSAPPRPTLIQLDPRAVHGSARDVALASALAAGAATGLRPLLVVEPLYAPASTWIDGGLFARPAAIPRFFEDFTVIATHYALLSELCRVDTLCLGSGLGAASRTRPEEGDLAWRARAKATREDGWRRLTDRVRGVFGGALTYAAHPGEASSIGHWEVFDLVGLLGFDRLTRSGEEPNDARIAKLLAVHVAGAGELARSEGRPALFVQLGFPARAGSFGNPALPAGAVAPLEQDRYYRILEQVLASGEPGADPVGLFLWHWNTDPDLHAEGGFSPQGAPAEARVDGILRLR